MTPSVRRSASRNTALSIRAVVIARSESWDCPPGVVRGAAFHCLIASSLTQPDHPPTMVADAA